MDASEIKFTRLASGSYRWGSYFVYRERSEYGDLQWIVDSIYRSSLATCDTLRQARATIAAIQSE